jgi:hypothetical protein
MLWIRRRNERYAGRLRVCYYDVTQDNVVILLLIYAKNVQEDVSAQDKKDFKALVKAMKGKRHD